MHAYGSLVRLVLEAAAGKNDAGDPAEGEHLEVLQLSVGIAAATANDRQKA